MGESARRPLVDSIVLTPDFEELARARQFVAKAAATAGFPEARVFDMAVACSEAAANAIEHAPVKGEVTLKTLLYLDRLEIQVLGPGEFQAPHRLKDGRSHRGLGLPLMAQFSDHLALYSGPAGGTLASLTFYRHDVGPSTDDASFPSVQELVDENELVSAISGNAPVGLFVLDQDLRYKWVNQAYRQFLDEPFRSVDLSGLYVGDVVPGADASDLEELREASRTGMPRGPVERRLGDDRAGMTWWRRSVVPLTAGAAGPPYDLLVLISDETERIQAKEALQEREERFRSLVEGFAQAVWETDPDGAVVADNPLWRAYTGQTVEESLGYGWVQAVHPDEREYAERQWRQAVTVRGNVDAEFRLRHVLGGYRWTNARAVPLIGADDSVVKWVCMNIDIDARKRTEEALRRSEERQAFLLKLADALRPLSDPLEIQATVTRTARDYFRADRCYYCEIEGDNAIIWGDASQEGLLSVVGTYPMSKLPIFKAVVDAGRPFIVRDSCATDLIDEELKQLCIQLGIISFADVPVIKNGRPVGILCITQCTQREWSDFEVELAAETAERTWAAVERARAEKALRRSEEKFRTLSNAAPALIWQTDAEGGNVFVNQHFLDFTGKTVGEIQGGGWHGLIHPDDAEGYIGGYLSAVRERRAYRNQVRILRSDGEWRWVDTYAEPLFEAGGTYLGYVGVTFDTTERRQAENALRASEQKYRDLSDSIDQGYVVIDVIFDESGRAIDQYYVEANLAATRLLGEDLTGKRQSELVHVQEESCNEVAGKVVLTGESMRVRRYSEPQKRWYDSLFFRIGGPERRRVGNIFSDVTEEVQAESNLRFLAGVDRLLSSSLLAAEVVSQVGEMLGEHLGVDNFVYGEADEGSDRGKVLYAWRDERAVKLLGAYGLSELNGPDYWQAMHDGVPYVVCDTQTDLRTDGARHGEFGVGAYVVVPFAREGLWKYLVSVDCARAREWTASEINLVRDVARRVVARIERAQAEEALRKSEHELTRDVAGLRRLYELQSKLAYKTELVPALEEILALAVDFMGTQRGIIQTLSADGERFEIVAHRGYDPGDPFIAHFRHGGSKPACGATRQRQHLIIEDVAGFMPLAGTREQELALADGVRAAQSTPLIGPTGEVLGVLSAQFPEPHRPDEQQLKYVDLLAWTAAEFIVRHRASLARAQAEQELRASEESYRMLAEDNERLYRQQLNIAEHLQQALLNIPSEIGQVRLGHLYRSATEAARVGGDFYDVFEAKDGNIAILMGDVAGHGIQAARTGTLVKDVVHAFTHQSLRTHEVLRRTNLLLLEKDLPEFVTLFLGILDPDTGMLRYSSAGHPESMVKRVSGTIHMLGCGTSPLGVYPDATWKAHEIELAPGDLLLLYTDGITEARRGAEMFGEKRLQRLLKRKRISPGRLPHMILDQVLAFSGGSLRDDAAVLVLSLAALPEGASRSVPVQQKLLD